MAEQDDVNKGTIPPKVSPFAKPEGQAAVTPAGGAPRPITVRLKPVAPAAGAQAPAAAAPQPPANPKATARVPVPEVMAAATPAAIRPATVRLRPVAAPGTGHQTGPQSTPGATQAITQVELSATAPIAPIAPISPAQPQPQHPPTPGAHPLPEGIKPPSVAQVQAAKSKTSRISLDSAIGVAPEKEGPKTIRLKRPSDLTAPSATPTASASTLSSASARKTSRIPDSALPSVEDGGDSAAVTQKKTLKIKRPGAKPDAAAEGDAAAGGDGFPDGVQMTPIGSMDFAAKEESSFFTIFAVICAVAAAVVVLLLTLCLGAHAVGPDAGKNAVASVSGSELPWPGRIAN